MDGSITKGHWRELINNNSHFLTQLSTVHGSRYREDAIAMRDALKECANSSETSLNWQVDYVRRTLRGKRYKISLKTVQKLEKI